MTANFGGCGEWDGGGWGTTRGHPGACWEAARRAASTGMCLRLGIRAPIGIGGRGVCGWGMGRWWVNGGTTGTTTMTVSSLTRVGGHGGVPLALGGEWGRWGVGLTEWALSSPLSSLHPLLPLLLLQCPHARWEAAGWLRIVAVQGGGGGGAQLSGAQGLGKKLKTELLRLGFGEQNVGGLFCV